MSDALPTSLYVLRADHFRGHVGEQFYLEGPFGAVRVTLVDVREGAAPLFAGTDRKPFDLTFRGPPGVYTDQHLQLNLRHPKLGLVEGIFIGPMVNDPLIGAGLGPNNGQLWSANFT